MTFSLIRDSLERAYRKRTRPEPGKPYKSHAISTNMAIAGLVLAYTLLPVRNSELFKDSIMSTYIYVCTIGLFTAAVVLAIGSIYEWGYYFHLRREGLISNRSIFFEESAGIYRKVIYFTGLAVFSLLILIDISGYAAYIDNRVFSIVFLLAFSAFMFEGMRLYKKMTNKKHLAIYLAFALFLVLLLYPF